MAKPSPSETIMPAAKMRPILALSKTEPVSAAFGLTDDGDGVLLLDKKAKPKKVLANLKSSAGKEKLKLQTTTLRFGRAEVDAEYDPSMVRFFVNKDCPGSLRPKLVELLKKASFSKVELNVDPSLDEEEEEGAETVQASPPPPAPPPAPPPPPADDAALRHTLAELIKRIPEAAGDDPGHKAVLLKAAGAANEHLKSHEYEAAQAALDKLRQALDALARQAGAQRGTEASKLLPIWLDAKDKADQQIGALQGALRDFDDPDFSRIAEFGLNGVTGKNSVGLMVALREADAGGGPQARGKLSTAIESYRAFLDGSKVIQLIDDNPFGVSVSLRTVLGGALDELARRTAA